MNIFQYLVPSNPIASLVCTVLMAHVVVWVGVLIYWVVKLRQRQAEMQRCLDVSSLREPLKKLNARSMSAPPADVPAIESDARNTFADYCREAQIDSEGVVAQHIKAIFDAGWKGSRLEVAELIRHTATKIYRAHALLRSVLAVFIIIGLLGTLIGLSSSLAQLSPLSLGSAVQSSTQLSQGLNQLLRELKGAFVPSIWGVMMTFICVLVLSACVHFQALPVRHDLEQFTLTVWVPQLFPATSRKFLEALHLSEQQMHKSFTIAREMARFTKDIRTETSAFRDNLLIANKPLKTLAESATGLNTFAENFATSAEKISSFQSEVKTLYEQMVSDSQSFHANVADNLKKSATFQKQLQSSMNSQGEQIKSLLITMKSYEHAYIEARSQLDLSLMEVLSEAKKSYSAMVAQNQILANDIGEPLRTDLTNALSGVEKSLREELKKDHDQLTAVAVSVNELVQKVGVTNTQTLENSEKVAKAIEEGISQQVKSVTEGQKLLKDTDEHARNLISRLETASQTQVETLNAFNNCVNDLSATINKLDASLKSVKQTTNDQNQLIKNVVDISSRMSNNYGPFTSSLSERVPDATGNSKHEEDEPQQQQPSEIQPAVSDEAKDPLKTNKPRYSPLNFLSRYR